MSQQYITIQELQERDVRERRFKKFEGKTDGQREFVEAINESVVTICTGPAGCGKSHLALARGIKAILEDKFQKLILLRPLQECGRPVGFLPGELSDKIAPHMTTFLYFFEKFLSKEEVVELQKAGRLVIETIEFLRGQTLENAYIILDEAQNCSYTQLKMILTRLGNNSKIVVVGDATQFDLPPYLLVGSKTGFEVVMDRLENVDGVAVLELTEDDIVRSDIVGKICRALA